jgi:protein gp37
MAKTSIEWAGKVWNPLTGCNKISAGCKNCYAATLAKRLQAMGQPKYKNGFKLTLHPENLNDPYNWKKPTVVFANSMSDAFHEDVPVEFIKQMFEVMNNTPQHTYQVLTKRSGRVAELSDQLHWTENIWMGVSVENSLVVNRIDDLRRTGAEVKFLSCEPLIGPLPDLDLTDIGLVICGGESGSGKRPFDSNWFRQIRDNCQQHGVPFFMKQMDKIQPIPEDLMIREFPRMRPENAMWQR